MKLTDIEATRLTKVCAQVGITLADAEARFGDLAYGVVMARLITERDRTALIARSAEACTVPQRKLVKAFSLLAARNGDVTFSLELAAVAKGLSTTFGQASAAIDAAQVDLGTLPADLVPKYEAKATSGTSTSPANAVDVSSIVMPEEAV
jgi:hypothetical protein